MKTNFYTITLLLLSTAAFGQAGTLDSSFNEDGIEYTIVGYFDYAIDRPCAIQVLPDGKILVAGTDEEDDFGSNFCLVRYTGDGEIDTSFDSDGTVTTYETNGAAASMALYSDGRIVVAGYYLENFVESFCLVRYLPDGRPDSTFDFDGLAITTTYPYDCEARSVAIQQDGKIVAAGSGDDQIDVIRYNEDGSLDATFGNLGIVTMPGDQGRAVAIQPDGKIVVAGTFNDGTTYRFFLIRLLDNGDLDTTFDGDGLVISEPGFVSNMIMEPDGKIIVTGPVSYDFGLMRFLTDGSVDSTFGIDGIVLTDFDGNNDYPSSIVRQPDGKVVAYGRTTDFGNEVAMARYLSNGTLDTLFGSDGLVITELGGADNYGNCITIQPDGKLVGAATWTFDYYTGAIAVMRYLNDSCLNLSANFGYTLSGSSADFSDQSIGADSWQWDFGDGNISSDQNPLHVFTPGIYNVCLAVNSGCISDTFCQEIAIIATGAVFSQTDPQLNIYPNPAFENVLIEFYPDKDAALEIELLDVSGRRIKNLDYQRSGIAATSYNGGIEKINLSVSGLSSGVYLLKLLSGGINATKILVVE